MTDIEAPSSTELEVSLFGPGFGESILIHLGANSWIIVDSCITGTSDLPAPIAYLRSIGVDPSSSVKVIVATHWHDDHIRGLSTIVDHCHEAEFCCSMALSRQEFISNATKFEVNNTIVGGSGAREIVKVLNSLNGKSPKRAIAGMLLKSFPGSDLGHNCNAELWALSPSDKQIDQFLSDIGSLSPSVKQTRFRLSSEKQNNGSLVLWLNVGDIKILLGGDLEETTDQDTGWTVVLSSEGREGNRANIFKIPHHGSITGYSSDVWEHMVCESPIAILTPFNRGSKKLPDKDDAKRILCHTDDAFSTSNHSNKRNKPRDKIVDKMIKETVGKIRPVQVSSGRITIRRNLDGDGKYNVYLNNGACHLSELAS
ncbi:MAG: MBL fold metallo-hydrolase [Pseudomonadota bacterium]